MNLENIKKLLDEMPHLTDDEIDEVTDEVFFEACDDDSACCTMCRKVRDLGKWKIKFKKWIEE